ncbi:MAG TPA: bifunctional UDP-N-acetylglucosamine diphosphorylase/glucosamine-1-phosphate N-acetyltransferase GlmU, partial [Candidatus Limnocylindria bacterium]|nr:bifunctional UDP-N-acetylglucosamine diphosphorylase/glucosamine-1-phosphate N-acetyltransferase GlmU [Candidatus Limnocylindria bacterium]
MARPVFQHEQRGTGHAVRVALEALPPLEGIIVVVAGDSPLLTAGTLALLIARHAEHGAAATVLTAVVDDPTGYGRVLRLADGDVASIVEDRDASASELAVREINSGVYAFDAGSLSETLLMVGTANSQGEEYLTDVIGLLRAEGRTVAALTVGDPAEVLGVNSQAQLSAVGAHLRDRVLAGWMDRGVTVVDPATTWVDVTVQLAPDSVLLPGTQLHGATTVATAAVIGPDSTLRDVTVGEGARVVRSHVEAAEVGAAATVGPFSYLRPGTQLGAGGKIGAFVETKNVQIGQGSKVPHLSYVGDAVIGEGSNIGAATIFVNYDGVAKHRTEVGDHVRIGSDTMLVAPVSVGDGAYTAAGSVITDDVPPGAMAVGRAKQRTIRGWVARRRAGSASAEAAARATPAEGAQSPPGTLAGEPAEATDATASADAPEGQIA